MSVLPQSAQYLPPPRQAREAKSRAQKLDEFCEYAYDFENNELATRDGKHYYVYGNEAMKIWIYKAMVTARFRHSAYSRRFGTEVYDLVGEVISDKLKREEIKRYITEAVMVHPYMRAITSIDLHPHKAGLEVDVTYRTVFDGEVEKVSCIVQI